MSDSVERILALVTGGSFFLGVSIREINDILTLISLSVTIIVGLMVIFGRRKKK